MHGNSRVLCVTEFPLGVVGYNLGCYLGYYQGLWHATCVSYVMISHID